MWRLLSRLCGDGSWLCVVCGNEPSEQPQNAMRHRGSYTAQYSSKLACDVHGRPVDSVWRRCGGSVGTVCGIGLREVRSSTMRT